jgi:ketosteroid isomerase-like protein
VADFTGTMKGPMKVADGTVVPPTNRKFKVEFCTVAHWKDGKIMEEKLFYDLVGLLKQIGLM